MLLSEASRQFLLRLAFVVALALVAMVLQWLARPFIGSGEPFLFFLPAVALAAVWFGPAPGALVLLAGLASAGLDEASFHAFWQEASDGRVTIAAYLVYGVLLLALGERMRQRSLRAAQAQARLRLLAEETDVGLFEYDKVEGTMYLSPPLARLCGVSVPDQAVPATTLLAQLPATLVAQVRLAQEHLAHRRADRFEHELAWPTPGGLRWLLLRVRLIRADTQITHVRGAVVDITDRKRVENELHETQSKLQEADRRKDEFLATLAHELRNPLAPIRQAALLSNSPKATAEHQRWSHAVIERQVQHMALLLDDLLDISRITRGALSLRLGEVELVAVIEAAVETARPAIEDRHHQLTLSPPDRPVRFEGDALRLSQVVANLLTNAAKYTEPGGQLRLAVRAEPGEAVIEVVDSGIGIPPEALGQVFDMFTQLRRDGDRPNEGLGIGLALARGLVRLHGGRIEAHSDGVGRGSRFTVTLPLRPVASAAAPARLTSDTEGAALDILIADDNRDAAESLAALLRLQGHSVRVAFDGQAALEAFEHQPADACLLDIGMPLVDGNEVARRLRLGAHGSRSVLVAITGWGQDGDRQEALAAGFDHHLTKPVDPEALMHLLTRRGGPGLPLPHSHRDTSAV